MPGGAGTHPLIFQARCRGATFAIARESRLSGTRMSLQLPIEYPETFPDALGQTRDQFEQAAK